jgi:hypothetical protein
MASNLIAFSGVGRAGMSCTPGVAAIIGAIRTPAATVAVEWPNAAHRTPAAAPSAGIPMQRRRHAATTAAIRSSVKRGTT